MGRRPLEPHERKGRAERDRLYREAHREEINARQRRRYAARKGKEDAPRPSPESVMRLKLAARFRALLADRTACGRFGEGFHLDAAAALRRLEGRGVAG